MKSIYPELAFYGGKIECARTDNAFIPSSEVCDGTVSLMKNRWAGDGLFLPFLANHMESQRSMVLIILIFYNLII